MGKTRYENQTTPSTPPSGTTDIYVDSADKHTKQIDDAGAVIDLTEGTGGSGAFASSHWRSDINDFTAPPKDKRLEWNNATQSSATELFIDDNNQDGIDVSAFLDLVGVGSRIRIQLSSDSTIFQIFEVTATTDNTTYFTFGVTLVSSSGGNISDNKDILVTFVNSGDLPEAENITTLSVADINDPSTEFASLGGTTGDSQRLVYEEGDPLNWQIYVFDSTVTVANNIPFIVAGSGGKWILQIAKAYAQDNVSWKDKINTKNAAYTVKAKFPFQGTNNRPKDINRFITLIARVTAASSGDVKVFDATNALDIAEILGITNTTDTIFDMGAVSNLPTGQAIFEVQLRNDSSVNTEVFALTRELNRP